MAAPAVKSLSDSSYRLRSGNNRLPRWKLTVAGGASFGFRPPARPRSEIPPRNPAGIISRPTWAPARPERRPGPFNGFGVDLGGQLNLALARGPASQIGQERTGRDNSPRLSCGGTCFRFIPTIKNSGTSGDGPASKLGQLGGTVLWRAPFEPRVGVCRTVSESIH
jgi:hypothetical protein